MNLKDSRVFVYGTLKPNEIAFHQVSEYVEHFRECQLRDYALFVRDGMPFITKSPGWSVRGYVLSPKMNQSHGLLKAIESYESPLLYQSTKVSIQIQGLTTDSIRDTPAEDFVCTAYEAVTPISKNEEPLHEPWNGSKDPIYASAFPQLYGRLRGLVNESEVKSEFDYSWSYFNDLAGSYLLLVSFVERFLYQYYGSSFAERDGIKLEDKIMKRISSFEKSEVFKDAWRETRNSNCLYDIEVWDSRWAGSRKSSKKVSDTLSAWYRVRSNLQHRGKSAWRDFALLQKSLTSMANVFNLVLQRSIPELSSSVEYQVNQLNEPIRLKIPY